MLLPASDAALRTMRPAVRLAMNRAAPMRVFSLALPVAGAASSRLIKSL